MYNLILWNNFQNKKKDLQQSLNHFSIQKVINYLLVLANNDFAQKLPCLQVKCHFGGFYFLEKVFQKDFLKLEKINLSRHFGIRNGY